MFPIDELKFDKNGLIPAIIQDRKTGQVLTLAYMNRESLEITLENLSPPEFLKCSQWHY